MLKKINQLRKETGISVMECKQALDEAKGDIAKAKEILKKHGKMTADKKAERVANQGLIESYSHLGKVGVILELACETDFVAKGPEFKELAKELCLQIASMKPVNPTELAKQIYVRDETQTIKDLIDSKIAKLGENIQIKRFSRYEIGEK